MEKNNNSLLYAILAGVVTCFVCVGMVLLFPGKNNLKGNNQEFQNNEINLGDSGTCNHKANSAAGCSAVSCSSIKTSEGCNGNTCCSWTASSTPSTPDPVITCTNPTYNGSSQTIATCANGSITSGATATEAGTYTVSCQGSKLVSAQCSIAPAPDPDPVITCTNPTYNGSSQTIATCAHGSIISGATATEAGTYTVSCQGTKLVSAQCSIAAAPDPDPVITCTNPEYTGSSQTIATCANGSIISGATATEAGTYTVSCQGSKLVSKNCSISPKTLEPVITCLNPRYTGGSQVIATCENGTITSGRTAVEHGEHTVSCQGNKLVSKKCSIVANEGTVCCCTADKAMCSWMNSCTAAQPSPVQGVTNEPNCKEQENGDIPNECTIGVSIRSKATSITTDGESDINSYYTVTVLIKGKNCGGMTATYTASNGRPSPSSYKVPTGSVSSTVSFNVYPSDPCKDSCATASINGKSATACLGSADSIRTDWQPKENVCEKNPQYTAFYLADEAGANIYYSNYDQSKGCYTTQWKRYLCGSGGGSNPPAPTPTPSTPVIPHCYVDDSGEYHWTDTPGGSWKIIEGVTKEKDCQAEEEEACYLDTVGEYVWGKYATKDGYTKITSIVDAASCKKPTAEEACYKNEDGDYKWSATPLEGYTKVEGVKTPADCGPSENPGCYLHGNDFVWGKYNKITGYIFIENITEEAKCKVPDADACYQNKNGDYVWGKYGDDSDYKLVPSITDISQCKNTPDVPRTDMNVSKVIYIFMAILMISGIGFICYSSAVKKTD